MKGQVNNYQSWFVARNTGGSDIKATYIGNHGVERSRTRVRVPLGRILCSLLPLIILLWTLSACSILTPPSGSPGTVSAPEMLTEYDSCAERVLIMSVDGLRPDALSVERTPNIISLAAQGAYTWTARTIHPPSTLPGHASMLTGYDVIQHGVSWNDYYPEMGYIKTTSLFELAHDSGMSTSMFVAREKMQHIALPGSVDNFILVSGDYTEIRKKAIEYIEPGFGVMFIHLRGMDKAGHTYGWMGEEYLAMAANVDDEVAFVMDALRQADLERSTLVFLTADHGGHGKNHMTGLAADMTIPWVIAGPGVNPTQNLISEVRVYDTAATAAWALGLPLPGDMKGSPVSEAFDSASVKECELLIIER